ncbi:MAG: glycosyltransferase family 39 protein [Candidatus Shapirobacteria bacterium]
MPTKIKLILIILLAIILRFWQINTLPALNPDEAALGYNAYSLLLTGKDEHGIAWPIHFKSFGDYKPGGYVYLAMPFIKIFGLTPLAVRLPNLILSIFTIYLLYLLIKLLTKSENIALISAFVLAVSPWAIHFSRGAWESNTALFLIVFGLYLFYKKSNWFSLPLVAALYTYHSARLIIPVLFLILFIKYYKNFLNKKFFVTIIISGLLCIPLMMSFLNNGGTTRLAGVGLSADRGPLSRSEELLNQHPSFNYYDRAIHNRRVLYFLSWGQKYLSHFDLNFLFINGDDVPRSKNPDMGQLYLIELPLIILGIYFLLNNPKYKSLSFLVTSLLVTSPLASSLTFQAPSALRALPLVIPLSILTALGIHQISKLKYLIYVCYIFSIIYFCNTYFIHAPIRYAFAWNRGFSDIVPLVENQKNNYQNIYFTNQYDQPYILYLFFSKYDPTTIQKQIKLTLPDKFGFSTVKQIDNINFDIPQTIPPNSLVINASDFAKTGQSFTIYTK